MGRFKLKRRFSPPPAPSSSSTVDALPLFSRACVEEGRPYARSGRWTREEADVTVERMGEVSVSSMDELAAYVEAEDWDTIVAYARQEQTRKLIRGGR